MIVERYSDRWYFDVLRLVESFHREAIYEYDSISPESILETIKSANYDDAFLAIVEEKCVGILYGVRYNSKLSHKQIYQEVIWYMLPEYRSYGISLFKHAKNTLRNDGVGAIIMVALENSKTEKIIKFYQAMGFKAMERHYMLEI